MGKKKECLEYVNPNGNETAMKTIYNIQKEQLSQNIGFSMLLNRPSGLSLEQFKRYQKMIKR